MSPSSTSRRELLEAMARRNREQHEEAERDRARDLALTALACVGWSVLGLLLMAWALHTTDVAWGRAAFWGGLGVGNGGIIFTLLGAYRRGERRGDW